MEPSLHIVKSLSQRRREEEDMNLQMFIRNRKRSSRQMLEQINEDVELAEAMALAGVILSKKQRLERSQNEPRDNSWWRNGYRSWDDKALKKRLRMNRATFEFILEAVKDDIVKEPTPPAMQLAICLYRLAHGSAYSTIGDLFGVAESTAAVIFNNVCKVLVSALYDQFVCLPRNTDEWKQELESFLENWEFPCVDAWEGLCKHQIEELLQF